MKKPILFILLFIASLTTSYSQSNVAKSKAYYFSAEDSYKQNKYSEALNLLQKSEEAGGASNAYIESLRVLCYGGQKKWIKAKETLDACYSFNPGNDILKKLTPIILKVDEEYEKIKEAEKQRILAKQKAEKERLERERQQKIQKQAEEKQIKELAAELKPKIKADLDKFLLLEEGRPYLITSRKNLTSSSSERAVLIFYGNKYIIYTVPSISVAKKLYKDKVVYTSSNAKNGSVVLNIKVKRNGSKTEINFKKGLHYSNIFLGGLGDELIWTKGQQYVEFEEVLYYYYYYNTLHCDVKLNTTFSEHYYNPYIETGTITKTIDYRLVRDNELSMKLKNTGVHNKTSSSLNNPEKLEITLKPAKNIKMLLPQKKITYKLINKVKGKYISNNMEHKGEFLYFTPKSKTNHYAYIQFGTSYPKSNFLRSITGLNNTYRMSKSTFSSIHKSFGDNDGNGKIQYFTSTNYRSSFELIPEIIKGEKINIR